VRPITGGCPGDGGGGSNGFGKTYKFPQARDQAQGDGKKSLRQSKQDREDGNDLCGQCFKMVGDSDEGLMCDQCKCWYHRKCIGMEEGLYRTLSGLENFDWYCDACKNRSRDMQREVDALRRENEELRNINESLKGRILSLEERMSDIKQEIKDDIVREVNVNISKIYDEISSLKERDERKDRQSNLIVYNSPESRSMNNQEREKDDLALVERLLRDGVKENKFNIIKVIRLGRRREDDSSRPLMVKFDNSADKWNILKKTRNLKNCTDPVLKLIGIAPDLTPKERQLDKNLREELKLKRQSGDDSWYIKGGKLVKKNFQ